MSEDTSDTHSIAIHSNSEENQVSEIDNHSSSNSVNQSDQSTSNPEFESLEPESEPTSSTVVAVKGRRNRKPTEKGKQNRVNQLKTEISVLINSKLGNYEQALSNVDRQNFDGLADLLEYLEQDGQKVDTLCDELKGLCEGELDEQMESIYLVFNTEREGNIDLVNTLMDDIENAEEELASQLEETLRRNLADIQNAQKRQAEVRRSILDRTRQVTTNGNLNQQNNLLPLEQRQNVQQPIEVQQATANAAEIAELSTPTSRSSLPDNYGSSDHFPITGVRPKPSPAMSMDNHIVDQAHISTQGSHATSRPQVSDIEKLANTIAASMKGTKRTIVEPSTFTGDPLKFKDWESDFDDFLETEGVFGTRRMRMLKKFIDGEAKECIEGFLLSDSIESYEDARQHLKERYGKRTNISRLLKAKLKEWPKIQPKDGSGLQKFADFLTHIQSARKTVPHLNSLDEQEKNQEILEKLPEWMKTKWKYKVCQHEIKYEDYPPFDIFKEFVCEEAKSMNILGIESQSTSSKKEQESKRQLRNTARRAETLQAYRSVEDAGTKDRHCKRCNRDNHFTAQCNLLVKVSHEEVVAFFKHHRLCFNCGHEGHRYNSCTKKWKCRFCKREHPDCLHKTQQDWENSKSTASSAQQTQLSASKQISETKTGAANTPVTRAATTESKSDKPKAKQHITAATKRDSQTELLNMLIPVSVSTENGKQSTMYAMLDNGSDTTYISKEAVHTLNLKTSRQPEKVTVQTLNGEETSYRSQYDFNVRGIGPATDNITYKVTGFEQRKIPYNEAHIPTREVAKQIQHLSHISHLISPKLNVSVEMLIGRDNSHLLAPHESIVGEPTEPFAVKTVLGWTLCGGSSEIITPQQSYCTIQHNEFEDLNSRKKMSQNDKKFLEILEKNSDTMKDGTITLPLPFLKTPFMPNNRTQAVKRLGLLIGKLKKDHALKEEYFSFMDEILSSGHAEPVPTECPPDGKIWYLPHFAVHHPKKNKLRVVFDASVKYQDKCLNNELLSGPDHVNCLPGILLRFRKEPIAFSCDIQKMFLNFKVNTEERDYLRFLWVDRDLETIKEYRMTVHLFGATSSPGVATFALRKLASEASEKHPAAANFIIKDFYVDDGIRSVKSPEEAINLIRDTTNICKAANLRLHKFISNSREVLEAIPESEKAANLQGLHLYKDTLPSERTLGLEWCTETDAFIFTSNPIDKPATKRGILSSVSQIYDPLGFLAPFLLQGKIVMQQACQESKGWDDEVSPTLQSKWKQWKDDLNNLNQIRIPRCLKPTEFGDVKRTEIHYFSDASLDGYGACAYSRIINNEGNIHVTLIAAKSKVVPLKGLTIPRLELQSSVEATRLKSFIGEELDMDVDQEFFWSDSKAALGFIKNNDTPFQMFTANRVSEIRRHSNPKQWHHVPGSENPADTVSRGASVSQLMKSTWYNGPSFLHEPDISHKLTSDLNFEEAIENSPEIKRKKTGLTILQTEKSTSQTIIEKFSSWRKLVRAVANAKAMLRHKCFKKQPIENDEIKSAEKAIILMEQSHSYIEEVNSLSNSTRVRKSSKIASLTPFLDKENTLRMNSRVTTHLTYEENHPIIIAKSLLAKLLVRHYHELTHHQGSNSTVAAIRQAGFWIVGAPTLAKSIIRNCITCLKQRSKPLQQLMAPLPKERSEPSPPFTQIGIDTFGPFEVKDRRTVIKRWGVVFTCLYSRALHIELLEDLSADSFLQALRRFESICGSVATIYCDGGTNFLGGRNQQEKDLLTMRDNKLKQYLLAKKITYKVNSPTASHQGGVWERQIRSIRSIMNSMFGKYSQRLSTEALRTAFYEIMASINNRPLSGTNATDTDPIITANRLLTAKSGFTAPPPGDFDNEEVYGRSMYRKSQQLAQEFWYAWTTQYLTAIEKRTQWQFSQPDLKVGDLVTIVDSNEHRNYWRTGRVISIHRGVDHKVRKASVLLGTSDLDKLGKPTKDRTILERPVQKLVRFMSCN
ncbi:uncharacterized protein [Watersipora subatra]|uniref:uncharacterized protein n=1 Tax=Watersipora subatra TaxID=2589382 RepID=UPI00355AEBE6